MSLLIKDTTKEEREEIVAKSIGNISELMMDVVLESLKCIRIILMERKN